MCEGDVTISKHGVSVGSVSTSISQEASPNAQPSLNPPERKKPRLRRKDAAALSAHEDSATADSERECENGTSSVARSAASASASTPHEGIAVDDVRTAGAVGKGSGGIVQAGVHEPSGQLVALKRIRLPACDEETRKHVVQELRALKRADHELIMPLLGATLRDGTIIAALEFMGGGSLKDLLNNGGKMPERCLRPVASSMLEALAYLHSSLHIVHRDVKPANVLLGTDGCVKLGDLGVSGQLADSLANCHSWVGTMSFMSPERLNGEPYSYASDTWSAGLTLAECALGEFPFTQTGKGCFWDLLDTIVQGNPPTLDTCHDPSLQDLVSKCLIKDPSERPLAASLRSHSFPLRSSKLQFELGSIIAARMPDDVEALLQQSGAAAT